MICRATLTALFSLLACADAPPSPPLPVPVQMAPTSVLTPGTEPTFSVGLADGPDEYLFADIAGAVRVNNGDMIVAVRGFHEIRRFGPDGGHLWTAGKEGVGPGEFRGLKLLGGCTTGSSVIAYDGANNTITRIDGEGNVVSSDRFERFPFGYDIACAPGGRLILSDWVESSSDQPTFRWRQALAYAEDVGSRLEVLRRDIPGADRFQAFYEGVPRSEGPSTWGRSLVFAPTDEGVWMATGDDYEVEFLNWTGTTIRWIRWNGPDREASRAQLGAFRDRLCRGYRLLGRENWREMCAKRWEAEEPLLPSAFPSVARLLVASDGRLWVEHFRRPGESREWLVFDSAGKWASSIRVPMRMFLQDAGRDWILVRRTTNDLGVEMLEMYRTQLSQEVTP